MEFVVEDGKADVFLGPLMRAPERGCLEVVQWFVERGCKDIELCLVQTGVVWWIDCPMGIIYGCPIEIQSLIFMALQYVNTIGGGGEGVPREDRQVAGCAELPHAGVLLAGPRAAKEHVPVEDGNFKRGP